MKKTVKKMSLSRETLHQLNLENGMIRGAMPTDVCTNFACSDGLCSKSSCLAVTCTC